MTFFLILGFIIMLLIDLPRLIKKKQLRLFIVYGVLYAATFTLCLMLNLGIQIPSPLVVANDFFKQVLHISY